MTLMLTIVIGLVALYVLVGLMCWGLCLIASDADDTFEDEPQRWDRW